VLVVVAVAVRVIGEASELGERVAEVLAVGIDDGSSDRPTGLLGEEHEVGADGTDPPAVLVGDGERILAGTSGVPVPADEPGPVVLPVENLGLPLVAVKAKRATDLFAQGPSPLSLEGAGIAG
jgi:hypothetical protein